MLAVTRVAKTTDHLEAEHRSHTHVLLAQRLSMNVAAHARSAKIRWLFRAERNQLHSDFQLLLVKQTRKLDQSSDTARVVVSARQWARCVVVCTDDDPLFCLWSKMSDYVSVKLPSNPVDLFRNKCAGLGELVVDVRGNLIEVLRVSFITRTELD